MRIIKSAERCPYCKEKIIAGATKCKHCYSDLTQVKKKKGWWQKYNNFKVGLIFGSSVALIILLFIYFYFIH